MKAATVIILLAALVCSAVCDPDRPNEKQNTAEANGYGYGGRSRGNNYDNDDSYGYKDGYAAKRRGPFPRVYPDDDDDYYPSKETCLCSTDLGASTLSTANNCVASCTTTVGGFCEGTGLTNIGCDCVTTAAYGTSTTFATCRGKYGVGNGGGLCLQFTCPIDGTISIQGQAATLPCGTNCGLEDFLYIYRGTAFTSNQADILRSNEQSPDVTVECNKNDTFFVCEKAGIIITSTVKATFLAQSSGACTNLGTSNTWTTRQCRN